VVDLKTGRVGLGDLLISSEVSLGSGETEDWSYELSIPDGGLAERVGRFNFEAPIQGYQPKVKVSMMEQANHGRSGAERDYFAKLPNGTFGRFSIRFYPRERNFVVIEAYLNPVAGRRNLEFDPAKQVHGY